MTKQRFTIKLVRQLKRENAVSVKALFKRLGGRNYQNKKQAVESIAKKTKRFKKAKIVGLLGASTRRLKKQERERKKKSLPPSGRRWYFDFETEHRKYYASDVTPQENAAFFSEGVDLGDAFEEFFLHVFDDIAGAIKRFKAENRFGFSYLIIIEEVKRNARFFFPLFDIFDKGTLLAELNVPAGFKDYVRGLFDRYKGGRIHITKLYVTYEKVRTGLTEEID